jgi:general transcription factor 3C protein 4
MRTLALTVVCRACRPSDFSYKHDARHVSRLVAAQMWAEDADVDVLVRLQHLFAEERSPSPLS